MLLIGLLPQLSASAKSISMDRLLELIKSDSTMLFLGADQGGEILGMLSLDCYKNSNWK